MNRDSSPISSSSSSSSSSSIIDNLESTASSSPKPWRILCFRNDSWVDFDRPVQEELMSRALIQGKPTLQLPVNGRECVFDFRRLLMTDLAAETEASIAWIDGKGRCFFPKVAVERRSRFLGSAKPMESEEKLYKLVERLFLNGMRRVGRSNARVTGIRKCLNSGQLGRFNTMMAEMKETRGGDGRSVVRYGWYGADADEVAHVVRHGFRMSNEREVGFHGGAYGVGVHLSSPPFPSKSSLLCEPDECDEMHIVLCRVITGRPEEVEAGSLQEHPSSDEYDSGVDDLTNPKWYVVWNVHMNASILPEFVVTFKAPSTPAPLRSPLMAPEGLSFPRLLMEMGRWLPGWKTRHLEVMYRRFKGGRMSKQDLIRDVRSLAGDELIASTIKGIRGW